MVRYKINLLPWREELKKKRKVRLALLTCGLYPLFMGLFSVGRFMIDWIVNLLSFFSEYFVQLFNLISRKAKKNDDSLLLDTRLKLQELERFKTLMSKEEFEFQKELILEKACNSLLKFQELHQFQTVMSEKQFEVQKELIAEKNQKGICLDKDLQELEELQDIMSEEDYLEQREIILAKHCKIDREITKLILINKDRQ